MESSYESVEIAARSLAAMKSPFSRGAILHRDAPWRAHLYERLKNTAWYCLDAVPETDHWFGRLQATKTCAKGLFVGIAGPFEVIKDETVLLKAYDLGAKVMAFVVHPATQQLQPVNGSHASVADFIYACNLKISVSAVSHVLNGLLAACGSEKNKQRKGVLLEVLVAVLLSQVDGFEVIQRGISNRTQQIDVGVHNRNTSGVLRRGELVLAEAKNWKNPPGVPEYASFVNKLGTKRGSVELGIFVTTDRFPKTVELEDLRNSRESIVVLTLDKTSLPALWGTPGKSITQMLEQAVLQATLR